MTPCLATNNELAFKKHQLNCPLSHRITSCWNIWNQSLRNLSALEDDHSFVGAVQKTLYSAIPADYYHPWARSLGLSVRSLQRMLNDNGLNYKGLVNQV